MNEVSFVQSPQEIRFVHVIELLKPRVMSLVIFTSLVGLIVAPVDIHPVLGLASLIFIAIGAGASGALNMWWDADIDSVMKRTRTRPIPMGLISADETCLLGLWLAGFSVVMLALTANFLAAGLLAFTIFFYVCVYTMFLKRTTSQNIVIGGLAGALPPLIGWTVATNGIAFEPLLLVLLIFMWTPPHFWALALATKEDYSKVGVPMLTVARGDRYTRKSIFGYSASLMPIGLLIAFSSIGGPLTLFLVLLLNARLIVGAFALLGRDAASGLQDNHAVEKRFFRLSITYLFVLFAGVALEDIYQDLFGLIVPWPEIA